jgi:hypothetical protein
LSPLIFASRMSFSIIASHPDSISAAPLVCCLRGIAPGYQLN